MGCREHNYPVKLRRFILILGERVSSLGLYFLFRESEGKLHNLGLHRLAGFEADNGTSGNGHVVFRAIGVTTNARLPKFHFKNPKFPKLHILATSKAFREMLEGSVNNIKYLGLYQPGLVTDAYDQISFS